jgi:glycine/D-amino acid oxidase-like deaminating enzyme/nitrite reductase/ring-hydroxylating ferredoxin subunit
MHILPILVHPISEVKHMVNKSIWSTSAFAKARPSLQGNIHTDVAVIGGGMAGVLIAHFLVQAGVQCVVLEAERIGSGQTKNTTAKVTSQHGLIYNKLLQSVGEEKARQYAQANQEAIERYRILIQKYNIDADWQESQACLYTSKETKELYREYEAATRLGIKADLSQKVPLPFDIKQGLMFPGQGQFHPLKFLYSIAENLMIYEKTKVITVEEHIVKTENGSVFAGHVVFACHYPFLNRPGYYFLRMHQERSYVLAVKHPFSSDSMYYGIDDDGISIRQWGEIMLLGGGAHRTGENKAGNPYEYLSHAVDLYWPGSQEVSRWSAQDCITLDGVPYIGQYSKEMPYWYVATGFMKWGMTSSMVSAMILSDMICHRKNEYMDVFTPQRFRLQTSAGTLFNDAGHVAAGILNQMTVLPGEKLKNIHLDQGGIVEYKGNKYGVYKDKKGGIYAVYAKCPHLGCQLQWNKEEKSWDCPCHGSRFDYKGKRLNEPAQEDILCLIKKGK